MTEPTCALSAALCAAERSSSESSAPSVTAAAATVAYLGPKGPRRNLLEPLECRRKKQLVAPGIATSKKKLLVSKGP